MAQRLALRVAELPEKLLLRSTKAQLKLTAEAVNMNTEKTYENGKKVQKTGRKMNRAVVWISLIDKFRSAKLVVVF